MTERLSALLHDEASGLDVPPAPAAAVLTHGRRRRRRTQVTTAVVAVVAVVVVAGLTLGAVRLADGPGRDPSLVTDTGPDADGVAADLGPVFSVGAEVFLDAGATSATVDDVTVKSLYYTSAGVLVRHGRNSYSDGGGPQRFSLVAPDGSVTRLGLETEETVHATDPDQPYVAYAQLVDGTVHVRVRDVTSDVQVADVPVPGDTSTFSPVALDGDVVYLGDGETVHLVDWRTGEVTDSAVLTGYPDVAGGRALTTDDSDDTGGSAVDVVDARNGDPLLRIDLAETDHAVLSPDGGAVAVVDQMAENAPLEVHDVTTGASRSVPIDGDWGWTADGRLFALADDGVLSTCSATGRCEQQQLDLPVLPDSVPDQGETCTEADDGTLTCQTPPGEFTDFLALGGRTYES